MSVRDLANQEVVTVDRDTDAAEIARTMGDQQVGSVVITEDDEPVGIVTDRAIGLSVGQEDDPTSLSAEELMNEDPTTIRGDESGYTLAARLGDAKVRRLPVVGDDGSLEGIVSLDDLVATSAEQLEEASNVIEAQSPGYDPDER